MNFRDRIQQYITRNTLLIKPYETVRGNTRQVRQHGHWDSQPLLSRVRHHVYLEVGIGTLTGSLHAS